MAERGEREELQEPRGLWAYEEGRRYGDLQSPPEDSTWQGPFTRSMQKEREQGGLPQRDSGEPKSNVSGPEHSAESPERSGAAKSNVLGAESGVIPDPERTPGGSGEEKGRTYLRSGPLSLKASLTGLTGDTWGEGKFSRDEQGAIGGDSPLPLWVGKENVRPPPGLGMGRVKGVPLQPALPKWGSQKEEWWKVPREGEARVASSYATAKKVDIKVAQPQIAGLTTSSRPAGEEAQRLSPRESLGASTFSSPAAALVTGRKGVPKPVVMPGKFDGTTDLGEYLSHFDLCIMANQWEVEQAGMFLGLSLTGVARRLLAGLEPASETGYWELREALERRFQPRNQVEMYKALMRNRDRKGGESLQCYAEDILRLTRLAYPVADASTTDSMARDRFVEGLGDQRLRHWIFQSKPASMEDAVAYSVEADAFLQSDREGDQARPAAVRATNTTMAEQIKALTEQVASWQADGEGGRSSQYRRGGRRDDGGPRKCYRCNQPGHYRRECPVAPSEKEKQFLASRKALRTEQDTPSEN